MLGTLIKKQYTEIFRDYFVSKKTGKKRSKAKTVSYFLLFSLLMLFLMATFFGISAAMSSLLETEYKWLFYAVMAIIAVALGTFGSAFNTYSGLYVAKDNDLLIPMPIPEHTLLLARLSTVMGLSLLYSGVVWIPGLVASWIWSPTSVKDVLFGIILLLLITLLVSVFTAILGWVVALVSGKLKNKSMVIVIISLIFFALYYFICLKMTDFIEGMILKKEMIGQEIRKWGNLFYLIGKSGAGDGRSLMILAGISVSLFFLCVWILSKTFLHIAAQTGEVAKAGIKEQPIKQISVTKALQRRELKRFTSSATYMLNCGLGTAILPIASVILLIKTSRVRESIQPLFESYPDIDGVLPLLIMAVAAVPMCLNVITTPSVSLEGSNIWIAQTMPVDTKQVLRAKENLQMVTNVVPTMMLALALSIIVNLDYSDMIIIMLAEYFFTEFTATFGLMMGLMRPNLHWTSETNVIKQSLNVLFSWLGATALVALLTGAACFAVIQFKTDATVMAVAEMAVYILLFRLIRHWLDTKGVSIFEEL